MTLSRAAYILAMAVMQSALYEHADDELREAVRVATESETSHGG